MHWKIKSWIIGTGFITLCNVLVWQIIPLFLTIEGLYELLLMIITAMPFGMVYFFVIEDRIIKKKFER